ncbi:Transcriptional activator of fatty acid utilization [Ceratocystis pirilliformis]|uniref:Transcriptional activator of fatty acid utilization n=1 Tax=Ceratocystis pirilliformis TaxID=259994 RepID=A0ABR3ZMZ7_9PEZI
MDIDQEGYSTAAMSSSTTRRLSSVSSSQQNSTSTSTPVTDNPAGANAVTPTGSSTTEPSTETLLASNSAPVSFRRQRASRACETCHARKVRCDAASLGVPCTNCVAFQVECRIPTPKRKKAPNAAQARESDSEDDLTNPVPQVLPPAPPPQASLVSRPLQHRELKPVHTDQGTPSGPVATYETMKHELAQDSYLALTKPKFVRAPITEPGRVAFLGESSNLNLLVHEKGSAADAVHYPLPDTVRGSRMRVDELDSLELDILQQRGAFLLPPRALCDEIVDAYFKYVHPIMPLLNKTRFMNRYRNPKNPPSLFLLQSVLLAGSRVCTNRQLLDANGSATPAALTFYKRAKALYDANYEDDRVTIVQSLVLMGWYWEGPEDVTKNVFYWTNMAVTVAQGSGMHRNVENSQLSKADKRLWKRVWWVLFSRDRSVAVALGRPVRINLDDSDVPMLVADDFIEDEDNAPSDYKPDANSVTFFLQYVKLCEIMGLVLSQQYSAASKGRPKRAIDLTHSDMALADWLQNCPIKYDKENHSFWPALIHINYYTILCLLHRAHIPPSGTARPIGEYEYPSRNIATQAAGMITTIIQNLVAKNELRFVPGFAVYSIFSALIMHVYQSRSPILAIKKVNQERVKICMDALQNVSSVWMVAKLIHKLFSSILGNKVLEERLQRAGIKRHRKSHANETSRPTFPASANGISLQQPIKLEPSITPTAMSEPIQQASTGLPPVSLPEQSQIPHISIETAISSTQTTSVPANMAPSTASRQSMPTSGNRTGTGAGAGAGADAFMGGTESGAQTRAQTPFNPSFSAPATPPDLYLFTRNSPNLSQSMWENFQPEQLFPEGNDVPVYPDMMTSQVDVNMDPIAMAPSTEQTLGMDPFSPVPRSGTMGHGEVFVAGGNNSQGFMPPRDLAGSGPPAAFTTSSPAQVQWVDQQSGQSGTVATDSANGATGQSPDSWSSSSVQGAGPQSQVPSTLNVEEWIQFFGFTSGMAGFNFDVPLGG